MSSKTAQRVQTFGRKKNAIAVAQCKAGKGSIKVNGIPLELIQPEIMAFKLFEPILLLGKEKYLQVDIKIRVRGGGHTAQVFAIRQAIAKSLVAYYQKCKFFIAFRYFEISQLFSNLNIFTH